jgi:citrate synthase
MENLLDKIYRLEQQHDKLDPELVKRKNIKLGLRNQDGTGVVAGITSKGLVVARKRDRHGKKVPIPGKLIYCGYDVEEIVAKLDEEGRYGFAETVYLLLTGELPTVQDLKGFTDELGRRRPLPDMAKKIIRFNSENDDQMGALHGAVAALHRFDHNPRSIDIRDVTRQCIDLIAKFPAIIAYNYHVMRARGKAAEFIEPDPGMSTAESFFYMLQGKVPDPLVTRAFDLCLILHADHGGGNNSTFTVRTVSSALTDTYMAICAGVASLAGHLHGGANEAVMRMMDDIKRSVRDWTDDGEIHAYLTGVMKKRHGDGSGKIYGMGHAVYTISDPREVILREKARLFAERFGRMDEYNLYVKVADQALRVIREVKGIEVCVNVDFFSGFVYDMMGIPQELFTPIFAMSRVSGWSAHRIEEIIQGKLIRPDYISSIEGAYKYVPISERGN